MGEAKSSDEQLNRLRPWLRSDYRRAFESGLAWGWERCRTEEERLLYPLLLAALSPYSALVAHRRLEEGCTIGLIVSVSRDTPDGVRRIQWRITDGSESEADEDVHSIRLSREEIRQEPWTAAARLIAAVQSYLLTLPAPETGPID